VIYFAIVVALHRVEVGGWGNLYFHKWVIPPAALRKL
jgi:hypothetical protein